MQKKSTTKIALSLGLLFVIIAGGLVFVASKKLNPQELRKLLITQVESSLPNAKVEASEVDLSLGIFSSYLKLNKFQINLKDNKQSPVFKVNNLSVRVPIWAIVFGGAKIVIDIEGPELDYIETKNSSNILALLKKPSKRPAPKSSSTVEDRAKKDEGLNGKDLIIPGFVASSNIDIKITNMRIAYKLKDSTSGKLIIERTLLKDLGISTTTAFEIKSSINLFEKTKKSTKLKLLVIGETKLQEFLSNNQISLKSSVMLRDIETTLLNRDVGSISIDSDLTITKDVDIAGKVKILLEQRDFASFLINKDKKKLQLKSIKSNLPLLELSELALKPGVLPVKFDKNHFLTIEGDIGILPKIEPKLTLNLEKPLVVDSGVVEVSSVLNAKYEGPNFSLVFDNDVWSGKAIVNISGVADLNNLNISKMAPVKTQVKIRDIVIPQEIFKNAQKKEEPQALDKAEVSKNNKAKQVTEKNKEKLPRLPIAFDYSTTFENVNINGATVKGELSANGRNDLININSKNLMVDKGLLNISIETRILDYALKNKFNIGITDLDIASAQNFLPKDTAKGISGIIKGKIDGESRGNNYDVNINLGVSDGEITKIDVKKIVAGYVDSISKYSKSLTKKDLEIDGKFKSLKLVGNFKPAQHRFDHFSFIDNKKKIKLYGKGLVRLKGKSKMGLELQVLEKKLRSKVNNEIGTTRLPVDLLGKGYELKPDYSKTISYLTKKAAKAQVKKQGKKQLNKLINKQLKNNKNLKKLIKKEDVNKVLKGLFQ